MTYKEDIKTFLAHLEKERRLSKYTIRNYTRALEVFFQWLENSENWDSQYVSIDQSRLRGFVIEFQNTHSRRTVHNWVSGLKTFFNYLVKNKQLTSNPWIGVALPKLQKGLPVFMTEKQVGGLLEGPRKLIEEEVMGEHEGWRDVLMLELLYGGGLRVSELVGLNYGDVYWSDGVVRVMGKGNKERRCPVGSVAMECLKKFRDILGKDIGQDSPILVTKKGKRIGVREVQRRMKRYLAMSNLPNDLTPHKLRHTYATHLVNHGANLRVVQEMLGHASLSTTQIYTHVDVGRLKIVHEGAHPRG